MYGHMCPFCTNKTVISRVARPGLVSGMPLSLNDVSSTSTCSACSHCKKTHRSFVRHGASEDLSVFHVVYSDAAVIPVHSVGGGKHAGTFTDAKTRYIGVCYAVLWMRPLP
jgi:hypothetical protein